MNDFLRSQEPHPKPSSEQKTEQQVKTQVHHPRLSITEVTEQRIIGSLPSLGSESLLASEQSHENLPETPEGVSTRLSNETVNL